jgi:hypothetical protein
LVDLTGIEPVTSSMPWKRAPSCATGPQRQQHPLFWRSMPNPSNALHVATYPSPLSLGERMFPSPRSSKFSLLTLIMYSGVFLCSTAAYAQAPAPAPAAGFAMASLRPALANVQTTISSLSIGRWKAPAETRSAVQQDVGSMQRDLNATLPGLITQAEANPAALSPAFAVFRNLDALYDVLLRVTETAALAGSGSDAGSLEDARAGLEDGRAKLGAWLLQSISAQDAQIAHLQASASSRPAAAAPAAAPKIVVDDGPENPKPRKKKPAPTPAPQ